MNMRHDCRIFLRVIVATLTILITNCQPFPTRIATLPAEGTPNTVSLPSAEPVYTHMPVPTGTTESTASPIPQVNIGLARLFAPVENLLSGHVVGLKKADAGGVWLITDQEIARLTEKRVDVYLSEMMGKPVGIDSTGRAWIAAEDGSQVSVWNGRGWSVYGIDSGWLPLGEWSNGYVSIGHYSSHTETWFGTPQDVRMFDGSSWTIFTPEQVGMGVPVYDDLQRDFNVLTASDATVWVFECDWGGPGPFGGRGVRWYAKGVWHGGDSPAASGCASTLVEDDSGNIWAGVDSSLWRYEPASGEWQAFSPPETPVTDMRFGFIESLSPAPDGSLWAVYDLCGGASCFGLHAFYHLQDGQWLLIDEPIEYSNNSWGPLFEQDGTGWLSWNGSVYKLTGKSLELIAPLESPYGAIDSSGKLWFTAPYEDGDAVWVIDG